MVVLNLKRTSQLLDPFESQPSQSRDRHLRGPCQTPWWWICNYQLNKKHHDLHHQDDLLSIDADEKVSLLESGSFRVGEHPDLAQLDALHLRMRMIMMILMMMMIFWRALGIRSLMKRRGKWFPLTSMPWKYWGFQNLPVEPVIWENM